MIPSESIGLAFEFFAFFLSFSIFSAIFVFAFVRFCQKDSLYLELQVLNGLVESFFTELKGLRSDLKDARTEISELKNKLDGGES